jgi:FkbM family methyltransferase
MTDFSAVISNPPVQRPTVRQAISADFPTIEICDVGAMAEGVDRYAQLVVQGVASIYGFEPDPKRFARLQAANRARSRYFQAFVGDGKPATFHIARYPGCSSLYKADPGVIDLFSSIGASAGGNFTVASTEPVDTVRLDDIDGLPHIDYLKLDVQGAELDVLKGGLRTLETTLVIESEVEFLPLYENQPLFGEIHIFLRQQGFVLHKLLDIAGRGFRPFNGPGNNPFAAMSQMLWADAIFVRDFSRLDRFTDEQLLKCAGILYEPYNSHDLVHHLLCEHDRRRNTQLAPRFANLVRSSNLRTDYLTQKIRP